MLMELITTLLIWGAILVVALTVVTVVGAFILGGLDGHKLTKPKPPVNPTNPTQPKPR